MNRSADNGIGNTHEGDGLRDDAHWVACDKKTTASQPVRRTDMSMKLFWAIVIAALSGWGTIDQARAADISVGDAYVRGDATGQRWEIGTKTVQMVFDGSGGALRLASFQNKLVDPPLEYVDPLDAAAPIDLASRRFAERFDIEVVWARPMVGTVTPDPLADKVRVAVKKGDRIGFSVGPHGAYQGDQIRWPMAVAYDDGESYSSTDDAKLEQGPLWFYCVHVAGTGFLEEMDTVEPAANVKENFRIPSERSGFRAPGLTPHVGPTVIHPSPEYDAVRVWRAPKDGTVTVRGRAQHIGGGDVDLAALRITERAAREKPQPAIPTWTLKAGEAHAVNSGGRPAVQLDLTLAHETIEARYHVLAFPGIPVLKQWAELENKGTQPVPLQSPASAALRLRGDSATAYTKYWMIGGNSQPDQGKMHSEPVSPTYHSSLPGTATLNFVPWIALERRDGSRDGVFVALDYLGRWSMNVDRENPGPLTLNVLIGELTGRSLGPGERIDLPPVVLGVFKDDLDTMAQSLYDWQYEYLWDYTNDEWYALMQFTSAWWADSRNLQEQFAGRLAYLNMDWAEYVREAGLDVIWDDAGWAANPDIWARNREGPDHAQTVRFVTKAGLKWTLWFPGDPTAGIMDTKVGSWGNFQWRTDAMGFDFKSDKAFRAEVKRFLDLHPGCSWQTCSGGSTYSHTFDIQRLGDVHYDTDGPGSDITSYYFSYLETPDKWFDNLATWGGGGVVYRPETGRRMLAMVPKWGLYISPDQIVQLRLIADLYRYLLREGVAGRWSYIAHPLIQGDTEHYYCQRLSHDRQRSLLIFKHRATGPVTIYLRGLLPEHRYLVEWESGQPAATRTGADLMARGISIQNQVPGELIYLNLPNRPRSGRDKVAPQPAGRVLARRETNLGFPGVSLYWSPGLDDNWVSHYEVQRDGQAVGKTCVGTYFFDRSPGNNPQAAYAVRTIDGDGNASDWTPAAALAGEPRESAVLGSQTLRTGGCDGWSGETSADGQTFLPMTWRPPAKPPSADLGGTPNQPGGAEGWWEGAGNARLGRGWQQASASVACIRTWTAPQAGTVAIIGRIMKEYYHRDQGGPLRARILKGTRQIWPEQEWAVAPVGDLTGVAHDLKIDVAAGDAIRFVLDRGTSPEHDLLAWMPRIVYLDAQPAGEKPVVVRILCGAAKPYTDRTGNVWSADRFHTGGEPFSTGEKIAGAKPTPEDEPLYQAGRTGEEFTYAIPVPPGLYSLRLKFAEPEYPWIFERPFNLDLNGRRVLRNFDICQAARGPQRAYERVFHYLVPNSDGQLVLRFTGGWEPTQKTKQALVQAIEVLPELRPAIRIDVGADREFVDWNSFVWASDAHFEGGEILRSDAPVTQASPTLYDQQLYRTARVGNDFRYRLTVPPGLYTVHLKFAELWLKEPGLRPMDIAVNGRHVWKAWDPAAAAGQMNMAADVRTENVTPDTDGAITIQLKAAGPNPAILQGIEVE